MAGADRESRHGQGPGDKPPALSHRLRNGERVARLRGPEQDAATEINSNVLGVAAANRLGGDLLGLGHESRVRSEPENMGAGGDLRENCIHRGHLLGNVAEHTISMPYRNLSVQG